MVRRARCAFALAALLFASAAQARVEFRSFHPPSLNGAKKDCRVYFPPSYDDPASRDRRYPVIVFLHGWPGSEGNWPGQGHALEALDQLSAKGAIPEVLALFPDGGGVGLLGRSVWVNAAGGRSNMEDYVVHDLVAWADSTLRTRPGPRWRAVVGLSDGATAAMNLVLRHPDVFGACAALSGDFRLRRDLSSAHVFGSEPAASELRAEYSPLDYLPKVAAEVHDCVFYFDCGEDDESIADNRELDARMTQLGIAHVFHENKGSHDWGYWREHLREALPIITARMR
ncbi:MAG TPA: alpha/beta hydrolase-fold protein [Candidatus Acidoferrales bacterium]|nr:alpha/beta hydrolase-fold protein [Candidatus Acidoferrales bacterium]